MNADISRQFEFVQHTWVDNANFAGLQGETDPLIGERGEGQGSFTIPDEPVRRRHHDLPRFVQVRGGAYFFLSRTMVSTPEEVEEVMFELRIQFQEDPVTMPPSRRPR